MARPTLPEEQRRTKIEVVRVTPDEQNQFTAAAKILGGNKSVLLHLHVLDLIEKAKGRDPERFDRLVEGYTKARSAESRKEAGRSTKSPDRKRISRKRLK